MTSVVQLGLDSEVSRRAGGAWREKHGFEGSAVSIWTVYVESLSTASWEVQLSLFAGPHDFGRS